MTLFNTYAINQSERQLSLLTTYANPSEPNLRRVLHLEVRKRKGRTPT